MTTPTAYFDVATTSPRSRSKTAILDGEVVVTDAAGRPNFGLLQHRINLTKPADIERAAKTYPAQLMLFDILELNGQSLIKKTYEERREILETWYPGAGSRIQVPPIFEGDLQAARRPLINFDSRVSSPNAAIRSTSRDDERIPGSRSNCTARRRS